ncbi:MAG: flippase [Chloroflexi bacterium]|nr:MAG: flippase [Chloroflexota bacterium]TMF51932.1 MAG: flippase [Chloroflexota bacterium]
MSTPSADLASRCKTVRPAARAGAKISSSIQGCSWVRNDIVELPTSSSGNTRSGSRAESCSPSQRASSISKNAYSSDDGVSDPMTGGRRVATNVLFNVASQVWLTLLVIVTVPIVLHRVGPAAYGVFVLASLLLGYTALLDLGLTPAVVRSIAVHNARGDRVRLERVLGTALSLLIGLAIVGGGLIALVTPVAVRSVLHVPDALQADARFVLYVAAAGFACNMVLLLFVAIAQGLQRLDLFASRTLALGTVTAIGQVLVVTLGGGLRGLALVTIAINVLSLVVFMLVSRRLLPGIRVRPRLDRSAVGELARFGSMKFLNQAAVQVIFHVDRLIVAAFLPIAAVSYYGVPVSMCQKFVLVQQGITGAFFPAASELHALHDERRLQRLYLSAAKLGVVALIPLAILPSLLAWPILDAWIGPAFADNSAQILAVLALAYGLVAVSAVSGFAADATGHPDWNAGLTIASAVVNLTLTLLLVPRIGAVGAAIALLVTGAFLLVTMNYAVQRWLLRIEPRTALVQLVLRPGLAAAGLVLYGLLLAPRVRGLLPVLLALAIGFLLYAILTVLLGVWNQAELAVARSIAGGLASRLRRRNDVMTLRR